MIEVAAYFIVQQIYDFLLIVWKETACQHRRGDFDFFPFVHTVIVVALTDDPLAVFVIGQFHID